MESFQPDAGTSTLEVGWTQPHTCIASTGAQPPTEEARTRLCSCSRCCEESIREGFKTVASFAFHLYTRAFIRGSVDSRSVRTLESSHVFIMVPKSMNENEILGLLTLTIEQSIFSTCTLLRLQMSQQEGYIDILNTNSSSSLPKTHYASS